MSRFSISNNIEQSATLPATFYRDKSVFDEVKEKIFSKTWLYVADSSVLQNAGDAYPFTLLKGVLDEPLVLTKDENGQVHCLSNVCTHRGKIVVESAGNHRQLSCGYHGRCFHLDGSFKRMPEFGQAVGFPTKKDDLARIPVKEWMGMFFVSLDPAFPFEEAVKPIQDRIGWMPTDTLVHEKTGTKDYFIEANWALYCDNYLEGFHIPFVHPALNKAIEFGEYGYEIFRYCNLQTGVAKEGEPYFKIPKGYPDFGKKIYAYYYWLFPNLMLNFYPWGLSLNVVEPLAHDRTKVGFRTYRFEGEAFDRAANCLEDTEMEDEEVVESVQVGLQSRFYERGRFSPTMEKAVHHFHLLIDGFMSG